MPKKMLIDATHAEETRVVVVDGNRVDEFDFESLSRRQLAGNIYLAKVTRVEPSLQAAFVEYGGNRHGFLAFSEVHPDYYQIPKADREALLAEEAELAQEAEAEDAAETPKPRSRSRSRRRGASKAAAAADDAVVVSDDEASDEPAAEATPADMPADTDVATPEADPATADAGADDGADDAGQAAETNGTSGEYEDVGGDDVAEERSRRRAPRPRRYKIQEVIKVRQILLVQVVKEERGNKGAALTTYLSLAGRYCVLMPNTARGGGISRKITNAADRKKLKEISSSMTVPKGAGLIIRTAGSNRTKTEIKRDYEYLTRQWEVIRDLTLNSIAPCLIYEEGSLVRRAIRDLYSRDIDEILVDGERGYREAKDYMKMLMPSHAKNVKHYAEAMPLFSRFQVESYLSAMFNPVVQLKSGGYIVIDVTEALVAIDVNSGRATREASIEDTALKTNMEAAEEAARQMRLRDLAGLIVIDFIDMEERRNNASVEKKLKDKLKSDRARIQVGRISGFGLLEMSRQRLRPGMIEATTKGCPHCHGTGRVRSDDSIALALLREIEEEGVRARSKEVLIVAPVEIANYLLNQKREHIAMIEARFGLSVRVEGDRTLISPDYRLERFKTASRTVPMPEIAALPAMAETEAEEDEPEETGEEAAAETDEKSGGKRKRRRRRRGGSRSGQAPAGDEATPDADAPAEIRAEADASAETPAPDEAGSDAPADGEAAGAPAERPKSRRRSRSRSRSDAGPQTPATAEAAAEPLGDVIDLGEDAAPEIVEVPETEAPQPPRRQRVRKPAAAVLADVENVSTEPNPEPTPEPSAEADTPEAPETPVEAAEPATELEPAVEAPETEMPEPAMAEADGAEDEAQDAGPRRRGWWSRALGGN